jgi:hypothetical protein
MQRKLSVCVVGINNNRSAGLEYEPRCYVLPGCVPLSKGNDGNVMESSFLDDALWNIERIAV